MGNYDHNLQRNLAKKMNRAGGGSAPVTTHLENISRDSACDMECIRSMEYLQRIVKSLLRQMNVHSHVFGPGEAITIDLQAELKYDDYITLTKFANSKMEQSKYLHRIDEVMSNFIHVVEHASSRFEFLERIINFPALYSLKFWVILLTSMVIGSLIVMLFVKAFHTRLVHVQLLYGFLIIFIMSCVWSFSSMYEDKVAEVMTHKVQSDGLPPKDCDYQNWSYRDSLWYFVRVYLGKSKDRCGEYYANTMTDPFWKVNPVEAISNTVAYFFLAPLGYAGEQFGLFYVNFIKDAPFLLKPIMLIIAVILTILVFYGPFRISSPLLTIEPWRPPVPALPRSPGNAPALANNGARVRNEIMERPDGPMVKSMRDAGTDMDGFQEYLTDEGNDELEINGPFANFTLESSSKKVEASKASKSIFPSTSRIKTYDDKGHSQEDRVTTIKLPTVKVEKMEETYCVTCPSTFEINVTESNEIKTDYCSDRGEIQEELLQDALKDLRIREERH